MIMRYSTVQGVQAIWYSLFHIACAFTASCHHKQPSCQLGGEKEAAELRDFGLAVRDGALAVLADVRKDARVAEGEPRHGAHRRVAPRLQAEGAQAFILGQREGPPGRLWGGWGWWGGECGWGQEPLLSALVPPLEHLEEEHRSGHEERHSTVQWIHNILQTRIRYQHSSMSNGKTGLDIQGRKDTEQYSGYINKMYSMCTVSTMKRDRHRTVQYRVGIRHGTVQCTAHDAVQYSTIQFKPYNGYL